MLAQAFGPHPFVATLTMAQLEAMLPDYLAMSQAFPYLQAAAQRDGIFETIANNGDVTDAFELTSVVGNFLCWDETGGHGVILEEGNSGLPRILATKKQFHSNLLR